MTTWPHNDARLMLLAKYIGLEEAYAKLERMAIADNPCVGMVSRTVGEDPIARTPGLQSAACYRPDCSNGSCRHRRCRTYGRCTYRSALRCAPGGSAGSCCTNRQHTQVPVQAAEGVGMGRRCGRWRAVGHSYWRRLCRSRCRRMGGRGRGFGPLERSR